MHTLIETVRASGYAITVENLGTARALAPDLATVAYRTLQEMLTNAIRHGSRGAPARVELCWSTDELRIEVVNPVEPGLLTASAEAAVGWTACGSGWSRWADGSRSVTIPPRPVRVLPVSLPQRQFRYGG